MTRCSLYIISQLSYSSSSLGRMGKQETKVMMEKLPHVVNRICQKNMPADQKKEFFALANSQIAMLGNKLQDNLNNLMQKEDAL